MSSSISEDSHPGPIQKATTIQMERGEGSNTPIERRGTALTHNSSRPSQSIVRRFTEGVQAHMTPAHKIVNTPSYTSSFKNVILYSWLNLLLVFIPISWGAHFGGLSGTLTFVFSFLAIIPLASLLGFATEELALRVGQTIGGLLNATLGNAVELIVSILALIKGELQIVQSSLIGSILSNILLVLGMCFFAGGTRFAEQEVMGMASQLNSSLLIMAVIAMLIPAAFHFASSSTDLPGTAVQSDILGMSHGVAVILLVIYGGYLFFQLYTHSHLYEDTKVSRSTQYPDSVKDQFRKAGRLYRKTPEEKLAAQNAALNEKNGPTPIPLEPSSSNEDRPIPPAAQTDENLVHVEEEEEGEEPQLNMPVTVITLIVVTILVGVTAEWLVDSINSLVDSTPLTQEWVGLILLPIVGNAAEHVTAVTVSVKDKLDLSMSVAIGSSIQISLFVIPFMVCLGWWIGQPLTMLFDPFESAVVFLSVLIVNSTVSDSKSNWLEGFVLMSVYVMIAVCFWYYPGSSTTVA